MMNSAEAHDLGTLLCRLISAEEAAASPHSAFRIGSALEPTNPCVGASGGCEEIGKEEAIQAGDRPPSEKESPGRA